MDLAKQNHRLGRLTSELLSLIGPPQGCLASFLRLCFLYNVSFFLGHVLIRDGFRHSQLGAGGPPDQSNYYHQLINCWANRNANQDGGVWYPWAISAGFACCLSCGLGSTWSHIVSHPVRGMVIFTFLGAFMFSSQKQFRIAVRRGGFPWSAQWGGNADGCGHVSVWPILRVNSKTFEN